MPPQASQGIKLNCRPFKPKFNAFTNQPQICHVQKQNKSKEWLKKSNITSDEAIKKRHKKITLNVIFTSFVNSKITIIKNNINTYIIYFSVLIFTL